MDNVSEKRIPPGPKGWPIIGAIGSIDFSNMADAFFALRKKYGDVFSFCVLHKRIVVVCGGKAIREVLNKHLDAVSYRADGFAVDNKNGYGIIDSSGEYHKAMREFTTKSFRDFGFEKKGLEVIVKEQTVSFLERLREKQGRPFNVHDDLVVSISNVICSFSLAQKFPNKDAALLTAIKENDTVVSDPFRFLPVFVPERLLKLVPGDPFGVWIREKSTNNVIRFMQEHLEEHKKTYDPSYERDFIDAYLNMQNEKGNRVFSDENLLRTIYDMFLAGTETSVSTIKWIILTLLHHPDVQTKMREEIESKIGRTQMPTIDHKPLLPYCEAVILEVQRTRNLSPFSLPRLVTSEIEYEGVVIPKDSIVFPFLHSAALDDKVFPNPEKFDPNNFLDERGQVTGQNRIIPFSTGKRVCIGEALARMELFLFTVSMVQNFKLLPEDPNNLPPLEGVIGGVYVPHPYKFRAVVIE
ncbi:hypothetical protein FSP39_009015 [Pinctada imbricata]|uniref:Uncharacterized protein n=1 Tax=Pinctada imbricata TaxID=66713 RepID=A0AA89BWU9_PINIB|nr:hypothetical protein FSP39_009015 [Pinctada imbricata]